MQLTGLDLNANAISIAKETTSPEYGIEFVAANVFDCEPKEPVDLIVSSLFTHDLSDEDTALRWLDGDA